MTEGQRSAWLQKLDAERPYQMVVPRRQQMDDSAIMDFLLSYVGKFDSARASSQNPTDSGSPVEPLPRRPTIR
jgi:hypothetical protein